MLPLHNDTVTYAYKCAYVCMQVSTSPIKQLMAIKSTIEPS